MFAIRVVASGIKAPTGSRCRPFGLPAQIAQGLLQRGVGPNTKRDMKRNKGL